MRDITKFFKEEQRNVIWAISEAREDLRKIRKGSLDCRQISQTSDIQGDTLPKS